MHRSMTLAKRPFEVPPPSNSFHNVISQLATLMGYRFARWREAQQPSGPPITCAKTNLSPASHSDRFNDSLSQMPRSTQRNQGKPVFVDITAAWCLSCQVNVLCVRPRKRRFRGAHHRSPTNSYLDERCSSASCADNRSACEWLIFLKTITPFLSKQRRRIPSVSQALSEATGPLG